MAGDSVHAVASPGADAPRAESSSAASGRISQAGESRLAGLESLRGMAAIGVIWTHAWVLSRDFVERTYTQRLTDGTVRPLTPSALAAPLEGAHLSAHRVHRARVAFQAQQCFQAFADVRFVVDYQDPAFG